MIKQGDLIAKPPPTVRPDCIIIILSLPKKLNAYDILICLYIFSFMLCEGRVMSCRNYSFQLTSYELSMVTQNCKYL